MKFIRFTMILAALLFSAQVGASPLKYSYKATLESDENWQNLIRVYPGGTVVEGAFQVDEDIAGFNFFDQTRYSGAFSGFARIGQNTVHFTDSLVFTYNFYGTTMVTMLAGDAWNPPGLLSETQPPAGRKVEGFQLRFTFEGIKPVNTPIRTLFSNGTLLNSSFHVGYGIENSVTYANWGDINEMSEVPEPPMVFLIGLGLIGLQACRSRKRRA